MGALAARERSALRAFLWLCRMWPVEFRLYLDASEFLRQELREEHSRFTKRLRLSPQLLGLHSHLESIALHPIECLVFTFYSGLRSPLPRDFV